MSTTHHSPLRSSYTAAGEMPWKLLRAEGAIGDGKIRPVHLQLIPTNRCNGRCPWCSCANVDRAEELGDGELLAVLRFFAKRGTQAVTFTGGGEPTLHRALVPALLMARQWGMECGLVTNGLVWSRAKRTELELADEALTWARMSIVDTVGRYDCDRVARFCENLPRVDVGVSFTVTEGVNLETAAALCRLAERAPNLTHVRFVQDIVQPDRASMDRLVARCQPLSAKAIFQYRDRFQPGAAACLLSRLKPLIGADGHVYPCCGVQYAAEDARCLPARFRMGHWSEFDRLVPFDGSICRKCFYGPYNETLARLIAPMHHEAFV